MKYRKTDSYNCFSISSEKIIILQSGCRKVPENFSYNTEDFQRNTNSYNQSFSNRKYGNPRFYLLLAIALSSAYKKREPSLMILLIFIWCGKWDLNPYVEDTRPSNVPVCLFQHCRNRLVYYIIWFFVCQYLFCRLYHC